MDSNYMFLCGVMWCRFGQPDAGKDYSGLPILGIQI